MTAIVTDRPVFPPAPQGAGARGPGLATPAKALREAQAAFFRPSSLAPAIGTAPEAVAQAPAEPVDRSRMRPGSLLDIRI
ncbi:MULTISPECIES: hypothetical protein [unclassified Brevundimonas]|uniref:hypothetical protein n=1 Tax=unclassified Brevundimonas TaxID=2622653 RepID=UPI0025C32224|nr:MULTISPECIES: hypothetical protein [unclassified Brevundimonas]